jgi:hypothetical protein
MDTGRRLEEAGRVETQAHVVVNPEPHWPGAVALIAAAALGILLPDSLTAGPGWAPVLPVAVLAVLAAIVHKWHDWLGYSMTAIVTAELAYAVWNLVRDLAAHRGTPTDLLQAALVIWSMNIAVFASWYWRLDEGGPHARSQQHVYFGGAFLFPQLTLPADARKAAGLEGWRPRFIDYLFLAFNTSTAFSPTDVPVLSAWAKVLTMVQASISLATMAMVAARAVNIL